MEGEVLFHLRYPPDSGLSHQIYASQLWAPYSRSWESPKGSGKDEGSHNGKNEKCEGGTLVADPGGASESLEIGWRGCSGSGVAPLEIVWRGCSGPRLAPQTIWLP
jgi:hypothetical protein